jgi:antitoxin component of RelBE/YafQ-DinJ toxin-antitoxin module
MTTVIINGKTKKGKIILELISEMRCGRIISGNPNEETIKAIESARKGNMKKAKNSADLYRTLGI